MQQQPLVVVPPARKQKHRGRLETVRNGILSFSLFLFYFPFFGYRWQRLVDIRREICC